MIRTFRLTFILALVAVVIAISNSCCSLKKNSDNTVIASPRKTNQMSSGNQEALKELDHFPEAAKGFKRFVILPEEKGTDEIENTFKVEIIPGKTIQADCNHHSLMGSLIEKDLEGWGYTYYELNTNGQIISTKMGCPDDILTEKFVTAESRIVRYNSKLPIVVYVPQGFELKFRIWQANEIQPALQQ